MGRIKDNLNKLVGKFKSLSRGKKIAFSILSIGLISAVIYIIVFLNTTKYGVLYSDMDPNDAQMVLAKLNEKKIQYAVDNNTIKVPEENVSELRLELAPQLTEGSKGYELLEDSSAFGMTDKERNLKYKMAIEGELAKTIKSLPEVKQATVFIVMQEDSNFFKEPEPSQASVRLEFQPGKNITKDQIQAIVSLLTGSVKNLKKEDVKVIGVINGKTSDLSDGLFNNENNDIGSATDKQQQYEKNLEKEYEKKILTLLSPKYGEGVKATVDVDADFDASEKTSTVYDPKNVVRSEETEKDTSSTTGGNNSSGPVDNNMSNTYTDANGNTVQSNHEKATKNYEVGKVEHKVISAPGKVKKVAASVTVDDENLSEEERAKINSLVSAAISYDQTRGDIISIEGMKFNNGAEASAQEEAEKLASEEANKKALMYKYIGAGVGAVVLLLIILISLRKLKKAKIKEEEVEGIDMLIDDNITPKEALPPINFETENEKTHIEKEIKKYATEKPEQVVEIIKAWMAEDER
ncbi:flagellar basal body M-ring protein FliF [Clostridium bovifaecis]|uniref:Flagellar M-ring protein n=1 Tax=Clostridium bovifaecis TaxID=2184719 RepID=A0A6I6ERN7_9CLOT|nr:flagellar basal body M-ring protein FliF [Clostridium bovifaecis]